MSLRLSRRATLRPLSSMTLITPLGLLLLLITMPLRAENITFPSDAGVIILTRSPYLAKGDGVTDNTAALQKALNDYAGRNVILYLPDGVYRVSGPLRLPLNNPSGNTTWGNSHLQGQSRDKTILRLKDATFTDPAHPTAVLDSGPHGSADWFHNDVRNLTIDTGANNPGAIGLRFFSNNTGAVRDVEIRSGDGQGVTGLDLAYNDMNGPLLVKNLSVKGFNRGVACGASVNSQTFSHLRLEGQREVGFLNDGQFLAIEDLRSVNRVPALINKSGLIALVNATLTGKPSASTPAIRNQADLYARNVRVNGYRRAIESGGRKVDGPLVTEFTSSAPVSHFPSTGHALRLPIRETPEPATESSATWARPAQLGTGDAAPALQAAIDSGATTIYLPTATYRIGKTVILRGKVKRIIGMESSLEPMAPLADQAGPLFRMEKGEAPAVVIERLSTNFADGPFWFMEHAVPRTLILKDLALNFQGPDSYHAGAGAGPLYIENVVGGPFHFARQSVWARQLNQETQGLHIENGGGALWVLGLKTERGGTLVKTSAGGRTEILGGLCYTTTAGKLAPMFVNDEARMSVTLGERCYNGDPYTRILQETRGGQTKTMTNSDARYGGRLVLYSGVPAP